MPIKVERTLFRIGEGGFAITLPKAWVRYYNLKPGDKVEIIANHNLIIRVKSKRIKIKRLNNTCEKER
jgi:bifunctional DNA-binding transcriptional regulator/antitoxin component of YhaV-PrlF toxin-antitoxin module